MPKRFVSKAVPDEERITEWTSITRYLKEKSTDLFFNNFDGESSGVNWIHDAG